LINIISIQKVAEFHIIEYVVSSYKIDTERIIDSKFNADNSVGDLRDTERILIRRFKVQTLKANILIYPKQIIFSDYI
jgi:hypothetical protein